jgi:hypothetical protein
MIFFFLSFFLFFLQASQRQLEKMESMKKELDSAQQQLAAEKAHHGDLQKQWEAEKEKLLLSMQAGR